MMKQVTKNKLSILGTHDEIISVKHAIIDKAGELKINFSEIDPSFSLEIQKVEVAYDYVTFVTDKPCLSTMIELSKKFKNVRIAYHMMSDYLTDDEQTYAIEQSRAHYLLEAGQRVTESYETRKQSHMKKYLSQRFEKPLEKNHPLERAHQEMMSKEMLFELQDKLFREVQEFIRDFTKSSYSNWF
jgi:hypothetical protein